jgi:6,7-dimethyl-8-ribityllumazine synthase
MNDKIRIGAVVSDFNQDVTNVMLQRAVEHAQFLGAEIKMIIHVPGVFDMPLAMKALVSRKDIDGAVALGAVIEGETRHDEIIMQQASRKILDIAVDAGKPIGLGISGHGMNRLQALDRVDNAKQAVESVVKLHQRLKELA